MKMAKYNWLPTYIILISQTIFLAGASYIYLGNDKRLDLLYLIVGYILLAIGYISLFIPAILRKKG